MKEMRIRTIEAHTAGEPLRIIVDGFPDLPGRTILEKRRFLRENLDYLRTALMWEPRGHADMYGALITAPERPDSDIGVIFLHNEGYSTMCGHGIIALVSVLLEAGLIRKEGEMPLVKVDTPAGQVQAKAVIEEGRVKEVSFLNVPSFLYLKDGLVDIPEIGQVRFDIAFGGAFYAFVDADELGLELKPASYQKLTDYGMRIKQAVMANFPIVHPVEPDLGFLYGTIFTGRPEDPSNFSRNVCIFADGQLDRSPTGTGVSARLALHYEKKEIGLGEWITVESILGTYFRGRAVQEAKLGPFRAIIPEISGNAFIVGYGEWLLDPADPLARGFLLG